jgi:hypothetical protein
MDADCTMIRAEIEGNNIKIQQLADERGWEGCTKCRHRTRGLAALAMGSTLAILLN